MSPPLEVGAALAWINDANGSSQVVQVDCSGQSGGHFDVGQTLADTATGSDREGAEGALGEGNIVFRRGLAGERVDLVAQPALGRVAIRNGVVGLVVMDGVVGSSDDGALRQRLAVDGDAAGEDFTGQDAAHGWREAHGLVDTGAEVGAQSQEGAVDNLLDVAELGADFLRHALQGVRVAHEVENRCGHGGGRGVRAGNDAILNTHSQQKRKLPMTDAQQLLSL